MSSKAAIIAGAGPAGLTAAYELLERTDITPRIFEKSADIGGISKTINYKGNRIDLGGHRFFSKSDRVMRWWTSILPIQGAPAKDQQHLQLLYQGMSQEIAQDRIGPDPELEDNVMLIRDRLSRIFYLRTFFNYPITLSFDTIKKLGPTRLLKIGVSYIWARLFPIRDEQTLEQFFINRFGNQLYVTFFKDYTEKIWGVPCTEIKAEWGAQRIKGLSITKAVLHAITSLFRTTSSLRQKNIETSLIEKFLYPKYGPGQMWEQVAQKIKTNNGSLSLRHSVVGIHTHGRRVQSVTVRNEDTGELLDFDCDYFFSTMPILELLRAMGEVVPKEVKAVSEALVYRDFITVGVLVTKLADTLTSATGQRLVPDTWIYVQERDVKIGRIQVFNNWSPYMVADPNTVWLGLEYFCNEGDELWSMDDRAFANFAVAEMEKLQFINRTDLLDTVVIRMPKTYPAYTGGYEDFSKIRSFVDQFENMFLIGRNGMHRYNNQDHSMLTAMTVVDNIVNCVTSKNNIWEVNTEQEYHESKTGTESDG